MDRNNLILSTLDHTWILDLDGTIVKHNGYKIDGEDTFLPGAEQFLQSIPAGDFIIFVTSRRDEYSKQTEEFLSRNGVRFDQIVYNAPFGERIVVNDNKPSGLEMSKAICVDRDAVLDVSIIIDERL